VQRAGDELLPHARLARDEHRHGEGGEHLDLAAVDILRDRERGVPRYNQFRRLLHKDPVKSFDELTDNPAWRKQIREVYNNDLEKVDLMTGLFAEPLPPGFGFSETAFRIFILMASRRLKSDRFFTDDFRPEVYTEFGIDYVRRNSMLSVVKRHYPQLGRALEGVKNAHEIAKIPGVDALFAASGDLGNFSGFPQGSPDYERLINVVHDAAIGAGKRLCGPFAWRDRPDFTCFQNASETAAIAAGVAAELGALKDTQGKVEVGPLAQPMK